MTRYDFPVYDQTRNCTKLGDGATRLLWWAINDFGRGAYNLGVCNCRPVRGGQAQSRHGPCAACDIGFPLVGGRANPAGWALTRLLLPHASRLGIQAWIWDRTIWSRSSPSGRPYTGVHPHTDHIHAELTDRAAAQLNVPTVRAAVALPAGSTPASTIPAPSRPAPVAPTPPPAPVVVPQEDEAMFLLVDRHGLYAVIKGVPTAFEGPNAMQDYDHARQRSPGVPVMWMHHTQGKRHVEELLKAHAATLRAGGF